MKVKIYTDSLDYLSTNLMVLPFFTNSTPLKGNLGFIDWRLNGFVSRLFIKEMIKGDNFEKILLPPFERVPADRLLLVCLGEKENITSDIMSEFTIKLMDTVSKIAFSSFAICVPLEFEELESSQQLLESFFKGIDKFAAKKGPCEFLENLRITFAVQRDGGSKTVDILSKYLSSRSISSQALINA